MSPDNERKVIKPEPPPPPPKPKDIGIVQKENIKPNSEPEGSISEPTVMINNYFPSY